MTALARDNTRVHVWFRLPETNSRGTNGAAKRCGRKRTMSDEALPRGGDERSPRKQVAPPEEREHAR